MPEKNTLTGVPETMLQTVYARARESAGRGAIRDETAEQIIGSLDYDFSLAEKDTAMRSGVIARTIVLDRLVGAWLGRHPGTVVVNLACGLDTRCYRMKGYQHWYNLDLRRRSPCGSGFCRRAARSRSLPCPQWTTGARRSGRRTRPRS